MHFIFINVILACLPHEILKKCSLLIFQKSPLNQFKTSGKVAARLLPRCPVEKSIFRQGDLKKYFFGLLLFLLESLINQFNSSGFCAARLLPRLPRCPVGKSIFSQGRPKKYFFGLLLYLVKMSKNFFLIFSLLIFLA